MEVSRSKPNRPLHFSVPIMNQNTLGMQESFNHPDFKKYFIQFTESCRPEQSMCDGDNGYPVIPIAKHFIKYIPRTASYGQITSQQLISIIIIEW
jgi:hypothetical protein